MRQFDFWKGQLAVCKETLNAVYCIGNVVLGGIDRLRNGTLNAVPDTGGCGFDTVEKDADGKVVGQGSDDDETIGIEKAHRWHGIVDPYLYTCEATLYVDDVAVDRVSCAFGVRSYRIDSQKGFLLNGKEYPLRGVCRHQDFKGIGNAITKEHHDLDMSLIREIGANTIRLAHYQHDQYFYDLCDKYGMVVWAEIPYISTHTEQGFENTVSQMKELITQNYNHPSIVVWGLSNEISMQGSSDDLLENHNILNDLCHEMDPTRLTTIAHVSFTPVDGPMHYITDTESYNHYFGWYGGKMEDNGPWLDNFHAKHPNIPLGVSEYGCEGIITYHGPEPKCKDYSEDYQALYHEHMAKVLDERPWIWSSHVWNMFDFGCAARDEGGVAGRNNKGLMTMDRLTKKDSYYIYKAYWNTAPMVHLCGKRYAQRAGEVREIKVYTNQPSVELYLNGKKVGETRKNFWGGYDHYDANGHKTGHSDPGFFGGYNHYDNHGKKIGHSDPSLFGGYNHCDSDNKSTGSSDPGMFGGYNHSSSGGCYIATCVYGSYDCPEVWTLRRYRDYTLAETWYGRAFIKTYYAISPTLVKWFGHTEWFKKMWQGKLDRMVANLQANGVESTPYEDKEW